MYPSPEKFNPKRWLDSAYPTYKEPLTEFPSIKGHHGFGYGRRACVGQDLVHAEMLIACGSLLQGFEIARKMDPYGQPVAIDQNACSPFLISMTIVHPVEFRVRSEDRANFIMKEWKDTLARSKETST